jgi:predicted Zn finger-like uncharacterized protein
MITKFPCPACQAVLQLSQTPPAGSRIRCPRCHNVFVVKAVHQPAMAGAGDPAGAGRPAARAGGSNARMAAAPPAGRSSQRMQAPGARPGTRPGSKPVIEEEYEDEDRPRRKPRKKSQATNLGLILGVIGGAAVLVIGVVVVIVITMNSGGGGKGSDFWDNSPEAIRKRQEAMNATGQGPLRTNPQQSRPRATKPADDGSGEGSGDSSAGTPSGTDKTSGDKSGAGGKASAFDPNANPFEGMNVGSVAARSPRELISLKWLPAGSDAIVGFDLEKLQSVPQAGNLVRTLLSQQMPGSDNPTAKLLKELDGNPLVEAVIGQKAAGGKTLWETRVVKVRNPIDASALTRAFLAEAIPALDGLKCYGAGTADVQGQKFNLYLCFPDGDDKTVIMAMSQQTDLDPLVRRGGDLNPNLTAVLDAIEPSHIWGAVSMEPLKPMLAMASMFTAQAPPEAQALIKELPKANGIIFQVRLQNNQAKFELGVNFANEGQTLAFSNSLKDAWTKLSPQLGAMAGQAPALDELAKSAKVSQRRTAALVSAAVSVNALKEGYPQFAAMVGNLGNMAGATPGGMPGATPGGDAAKPEAGGSTMASGKKSSSNPNAAIGLKEGNRAPEISGKDIDGKAFKLSDYKGKVVLLDFWGFW